MIAGMAGAARSARRCLRRLESHAEKCGNQSGIDTWRVAVVLGFAPDKSVRIGLADGTHARIPFGELSWARKELPDAEVGPSPAKPQDALTIGNLVYVEAVDARGNYGLRQVPEVNGGIVAMDPHTGRVLALSGGFSYASSQFDRAMQALRQPGSAFKPFVYASALDNGFTPVSKVLDAPFVIEQGPGLPLWQPENFEKKFIGLATLRRGIEFRKNLMTVRLAQAVGMDKVEPYADRFGVYDHLPPLLANALGSAETTLLTHDHRLFGIRQRRQEDHAFAGRPHPGSQRQDHLASRRASVRWLQLLRLAAARPNRCWTTRASRSSILARPIRSFLPAGRCEHGTGRSVAVIGKPLAGKTGTSNESRDTWFVGFSPDLGLRRVCRLRQSPHARQAGARRHRRRAVFRDFMKGALADVPPTPFRVPPGIEFVSVDRITGALERWGRPRRSTRRSKSGPRRAIRARRRNWSWAAMSRRVPTPPTPAMSAKARAGFISRGAFE